MLFSSYTLSDPLFHHWSNLEYINIFMFDNYKKMQKYLVKVVAAIESLMYFFKYSTLVIINIITFYELYIFSKYLQVNIIKITLK